MRRARRARHGRADRRRAGRAPRAPARAAAPGPRLRLPRRVGRRGAARRRAVHASGRATRSTCSRRRRSRTDAGELIWRALERGADGVLHCCGGEHVDRVDARAPRGRGVRARPRAGARPAPPPRAAGRSRPVRHAARRAATARAARRASCPTSTASWRACATSWRRCVRLRPDHDGPRRRRPLPRADRRAAGRGAHVREVARRQRDQRRGRGGAARRARGGDHQGRRRPVRPVRARARCAGSASTTRFVGTHPTLRTPVVFCEIFPPDDFPLLFYREPTAPDMTLRVGRARPRRDPRRARVLDDRAPGCRPSRAARRRSRRSRRDGVGGSPIHDLDHRPMFWADETEAGRWARAGARARDRRGRQPRRGRRRGRHARPATRRPTRCSSSASSWRSSSAGPTACSRARATERVEVPPVPVEVVNGLGAGDAFGGALVHGLLAGLAARAHDPAGQRRRRVRRRPARVRRRDADALRPRRRPRHEPRPR